jgi:hypothetical protein
LGCAKSFEIAAVRAIMRVDRYHLAGDIENASRAILEENSLIHVKPCGTGQELRDNDRA